MSCCYGHPTRDGKETSGPCGPCQFDGNEDLADYESKSYCRWHLPLPPKATWSEAQNHAFAETLKARLDNLDELGAPADFRGVQFPTVADFSSRMLRDANFSYATFADEAIFGSATFNGQAHFEYAKFNEDARFESATFNGAASFHWAKFNSTANFLFTVFKESSAFVFGHFDRAAIFLRATFEGNASFSSTVFTKAAAFESATFIQEAWFHSAVFKGVAAFRSATFNGEARFWAGEDAESRRFGECNWEGATFAGKASFENREFTTAGDFRVKTFTRAPIFHGCTFHQAMMFPHEAAFEDRSSDGAAEAYRTLRLAMEELSARHEVGMFYALEQEALRNTPGRMKRHERWLSWLYEKLSDYGRSAFRPAVYLLGLWFIAGVIYAVLSCPQLDAHAPIDLAQVAAGLAISTQQVVQPFHIWRDLDATLPASSIRGLRLIATLQSTISLSLVALILLAVRWRFMRE